MILALGGRHLVLPEGVSILGRSDACRIVLDDSKVSRRHARVEVRCERAYLTDLESANGVKLNGSRLRKGEHEIRDGDVITICSKTLRVEIRRVQPSDAPAGADNQIPLVPTLSSPTEGPPSQRLPPTRVSDSMDLIFTVAEQAFDAGHVEDAERVLREHLAKLLKDAMETGGGAESTRTTAAAFALRLAHETQKGEWFDYVIDLLRAYGVTCSPELARKLKSALVKVDGVDVRKLESYADELRSGTRSLERMKAAQHVQDLIGAARTKHRASLRCPPPDGDQ